jgi:predicted ATPase/transcriptional regulator with GAF, ATPase, and Fis domain
MELLREGADFTLYRGRERGNQTPVLAVAPAAEQPSPQNARLLEHEYSLAAELDEAWAAKPLALTRHQGRTVLILKDPGGECLDRVLERNQDRPLDLTRFLRIAIALTKTLGQVHGQGLIHKDIKPANVLVDGDNDVWLTGFGIASQLPHERQAPAPPEIIAGTLAYMAPEQTGRMNRSIDTRSDLYSLGVTFYQMLTGALPFAAADPMEWVHCHIARKPVPPGERLKTVPATVSDLILKLLAKAAEDRYQTAAGLERDLRRCFASWEAEQRIAAFPLGQRDTSDRLLIPEKLYGREREIETLLAAFDRVVTTGRPELVLVSGYPGVGKSAVVNELHKALVPPRGLFASGKYDQYKRDIPYATLAQAFQGLIRPLLGQSESELAGWRDALSEALGANARLVIDVVPELKLLIGEQPPVVELPPQQAQSRLQQLLRRFLGVFARAEHPLALFLDDLQWLDAATLDVLGGLLTQDDVQQLLVIGAYRDNEVDSAHPLMRKLGAIRKEGALVQEMSLAPLTREDLERLIADTFSCASRRAGPLAQLVHEKTGGNPFFAIQFISALAEEGLLHFDHDKARWRWELDRIHAKGYSDNVVDLMVGKLTRLPSETQAALQQLACLGNVTEMTMLSIVLGKSSEEVREDLWDAVRLELVEDLKGSYKFIHDRVQEAAYSLIPKPLRAEVHLRIGRLLATHTPVEKREEAIFEIVNQLNRGAALITSRDEREQLAELNLIAGQRARATTAYASALTYLTTGAALLPKDSWELRPELTFALELRRGECEFLTGALAEAEQRLAALSSRPANTVERATIACLRVDLYTTLDRGSRAITVGLDCLRHLGIDWSPHPTAEEARREYERIWLQLGGRATESLIDLPLMSDPASLATLDVLAKIGPPAFYTDANLLSLVTCRAVNLSLERGNCDASCIAYEWLSMLAGPHFGDYRSVVYRFGQLGYDLVERGGLTRFQARTYMDFGGSVLPWTEHIRAGRDLVRRAFEAGNKMGDLNYAAYCGKDVNTNLLFAGDPLAEAEREAELGLAFAQKMRFGLVIDVISTQYALIRMLRGLTPTFDSFDDAQFDERGIERRFSENPDLALVECWYWVRKLQARFFAGDYTSALEASSRAQRLLWTLVSLELAEYHFYDALARAALCDAASAAERTQCLEILVAHHRQLQEWAENCPENFENRATLAGAEIARLEGRDTDAMRLYEQAIQSARENGFVQNEGVAHEVAARFHAARGFEAISHMYMRNARNCYDHWGAAGKVKQLDERYPRLHEERLAASTTATIGTSLRQLDVETVLKASQALSSEIVLSNLIEKLMRIAVEHAGAERGLLILLRGDEPRIEAEATTGHGRVEVTVRQSSITSLDLPKSVLQYVIRTRELVVVDDVSGWSIYSEDEYARQKRPRSVLCLPIVKQTKLVGALYLENNLTPRAFTQDRVAVLEMLASQAAISLENARLYSDLQSSEAYLAQGQSLSHTGSFGRDVLSGEIYWSEETYKIFELDPAVKPTMEFVFQRIHPDDREHVRQLINHATKEKVDVDFEYRLLKPDGSVKYLHVLARALDSSSGNLETVGAVTDITAAKQARAELEKAFEEIKGLKDRLQNENVALREEVAKASMFEEIVGTSPALQAVLSRISKVAPSDSSVLITGETGTGKELVARAIHKHSRRSSHAFVSVNCAAIPRDLIASELFGHEKGAFTGATQRRIGRFELADGGTIFLDEVGELPLETQIALLRVLQEHEFERVGGTATIPTNVRLIAATNRDLDASMARGAFRSDLYYRLNVFPIEMPALRERGEDIQLLVEYFIGRFARKAGKRFEAVSKKSLDLLRSYPWPGNIRELQNVIQRSVIVCDSDHFSIDESWLSQRPSESGRKQQFEYSKKLVAQEKEMIESVLRETKGRVFGPSGAAVKLGMPGTTLDSKIKSLKIDKNRFKIS